MKTIKNHINFLTISISFIGWCPDWKYLFFWKGVEKIREDGSTYLVGSAYWVDSQIIEKFRPKQ